MKEYDSLSDNEKRNMLASVANLYYNAEMTQNQIAERFSPHVPRFALKDVRVISVKEANNTMVLQKWVKLQHTI